MAMPAAAPSRPTDISSSYKEPSSPALDPRGPAGFSPRETRDARELASSPGAAVVFT